MREQVAHEGIERRHGAQVQGDVHEALLPPSGAGQAVHPDEAAVGQQALLEGEQVPVAAEDGAVGQGQVVEQQRMVPAGQVDGQDGRHDGNTEDDEGDG